MKPEKTISHSANSCSPVREILPAIGTKWAGPIIATLMERPRRFSEIKREMGEISQKSLTAALRELEKDGFVKRTVTPTIPPRVDYELTPLGQSLLDPLRALGIWALENEDAVLTARRSFEGAVRP